MLFFSLSFFLLCIQVASGVSIKNELVPQDFAQM